MLVSKFARLNHLELTAQMPMEFLKYKSDAWGQQVLEGVSWDVIWLFVAAGLMVVVVHAAYVAWRKRVIAKQAGQPSPEEAVDG
jgi:formate dehydrogenase subunit gamma